MNGISKIIGILILLLLSGWSNAQATIRNVPSTYPTIQAAINASLDGDTVMVANGTFTGVGNRDISLGGKAITVTSANGAASSIIDCQNLGRGFFISQGEGSDTVISGFTIKNGNNTHGGGIYTYFSSPTISNCIVQNNTATIFGGGIACKGGRPLISGSTIRYNSAPNSGGVHIQDSSQAVLTSCTISNNTATNSGGGIGSFSSTPSFSSCDINGNTSGQGGGGAYLENSPAILNGCVIEGNKTGVTGGGLSLNGSDAAIKYSDIISNETTSVTQASSGGGIFLSNSNATILSCDISYNEANIGYSDPDPTIRTNSGGISFHQDSAAVMRNCTITHNKAQERGGVGSWNSAPVIESCEITANQSTVGGGGGVGFYGSGNAPIAEPALSYSTISGNYAYETGGGIAVWQRSPTITGCVVDSNTTAGSSGGMNIYGFTAGSAARTKVISSIVSNNSAASRGGIYVSTIFSGSVSIVNTLITSNTSSGIGGGLSCYNNGHTTVTNCTISGNTASSSSSGSLIVSNSDVVATNSIFWGNSPNTISKSGTGTLTITYSDIQGGYAGTGNKNVSPGFVGGGDYHLNPGSPCIDAGTNSASGIAPYDLERNKRVLDGDNNGSAIADMGVYEYGTYSPAPFPWVLYFNVLNQR